MPDPDDFTGVWMCEVTRTSRAVVFVRDDGEQDLCKLAVQYALRVDEDEWDTEDTICVTQTELTARQLKQVLKHPDQPEILNE